MKKIINKLEKGAALYFVVIAVLMILSVVVGISNIVYIQHMMIRDIGESVTAFYLADTGIERAGIQWYKMDSNLDLIKTTPETQGNLLVCSGTEDSDHSQCARYRYNYEVKYQGGSSDYYYILSKGDASVAESGRKVRRAIMLMF